MCQESFLNLGRWLGTAPTREGGHGLRLADTSTVNLLS